MACSYSNQSYHIYLAIGFSQGSTDLDKDEVGLISQNIRLSEFEQQIHDGEVKDATTITVFLMCQFKNLI